MLSLYNILTISKFEIKTLSRSWFLRIFAALSIIVLFFWNLGMFTGAFGNFTPRTLYGLTSSIPYLNMLYFNLVQAIISVFLASDFLKRDKKLDTTEAIYIRSMTNTDYIAGKALGILTIFLILNVFILIMGFIFNLFGTQSNINFAAYLYYLLVISIPTLVFIVGLTFLFMTLVKNQAITFVLLLGYVGVTLFYLGWRFHYIFDYTGIYLPLAYSDFIGFGNSISLVLHRAIYFFLGVGFIFFTMFFFKRLPQSRIMEKSSSFIGIIFIIAGMVSAYFYVANYNSGIALRQEMISLNQKYMNEPILDVTNYNINLMHLNNSIKCETKLTLLNNSEFAIDKAVLNINPALAIEDIKIDGTTIEYVREQHLLLLQLKNQLQVNDSIQLAIKYSGTINDDATNLYISEDKRGELKRFEIYASDKIYSYVSSDYVLLTKESMWYPAPGVTFIPEKQFNEAKDFAKFNLTVNTSEHLTPISQGKITDNGDGSVTFNSETPLSQISLTIGNYAKQSLSIDSLDYNLYTYKGHDYYKEFLTEIGDTLESLVTEVKEDFERDLNFEYPYKRINIVETPIQFTAYPKLWTNAQETVQPEIVFLPEDAINVDGADFRMSLRMRERFGNRSNQVVTDKEQQSEIFKQFIRTTFLDATIMFRFRGGSNINENERNQFSLFPIYYSYSYNVKSDISPMLNIVIENYLNVKADNSNLRFVRSLLGLTSAETAVQKLSEAPLQKMISDTSYNQYMTNILELKGDLLFTSIEHEIGSENLKSILTEVLTQNQFRQLDFSEIAQLIKEKYHLDLTPIITEWFNNSKIPGYYITKIENYKIIDNDREKYQVKFNITNPEPVAGYVKIKFDPQRGGMGGGRFRRMMGNQQDETILEKIIKVDSNQTIQFGVILDEEPGRLTLNTLISQNLPLQQEFSFDEFEEKKKAIPFEGEIIAEFTEPYSIHGEIVVDNEDEGFAITQSPNKSWLKEFLNINNDDDQKYIGIRFWNLPNDWKSTIISESYGKYIHSTHFTDSGDGSIKVTWEAEIASSGYYDVYSNIVKYNSGFRRRGNSNSKPKYHYSIFNDDGEDEVILESESADEGWNLLGSYYFSAGSAKVQLTNKSSDGIMFADAIKWVLRD